jgi:hypothetical protein
MKTYYFTISFDGYHLFTTETMNEEKAKRVTAILTAKFPLEENYLVLAFYQDNIHYGIKPEKI